MDDWLWQVGLEPVGAVLQLPIAVSLATMLDQAWVRTIAEESLEVAEQAQERLAESQEHIEDRWAEIEQAVAAKVAHHRTKSRQSLTHNGERSLISMALIGTAEELNDLSRDLTGNELDLGLLIPMVFGAIAIRQLLEQGLRLHDIPWYVPAWYAFDIFIKLNFPDHEGLTPETPAPSPSPESLSHE